MFRFSTPARSFTHLVCPPALLLLAAQGLYADAIVVSQAASAPTIAEFFVGTDEIRVEMEIGMEDLGSFPNLLPDELYTYLGHEPRPFADRIHEFVTEDFVFLADGVKLTGRPLSLTPRPRIVRDPITGIPREGVGSEEDLAVYVVLSYPLEGRPETLTIPGVIRKPGLRSPSIGFVTYHHGLAVNDFAYLSRPEVLDLDWDDPWYSKFQQRTLRRNYNSPMYVFLYVEPYEVRVEVIARPMDLQQWLDLGLEGRTTIPVDLQANLKDRVADFLADQVNLTIDGQPVETGMDRINFLNRTLTSSTIVDPPEELNIYSATIGVIFTTPTDGLPQEASMNWDLFSPKLSTVQAAATDQAGPLPITLEPDYRELKWVNYLKAPVVPALVPIAIPPPGWTRIAVLGGWVATGLVLCLVLWSVRKTVQGRFPHWISPALLVVFGALLALTVYGRNRTGLDEEKTRGVVTGLLKNVYHAFDFRAEETVYDKLAHSVTGDLLTRVYLETRRGLELASQGGARVKVKEVEILEAEGETIRGQTGVKIRTRWNVMGSVGHWGHVHTRTNQYDAELTIQPTDGLWKIVDLELFQEERIN